MFRRASAFFLILIFLNISKGYAQSTIPCVAHFCYGLWDEGDPPAFFKETIKKWKLQGWTIRLWNKQEMDELLARYPLLITR